MNPVPFQDIIIYMVQLLGLVIIAFFLTSLFLVPFIDLLFKIRNHYIRGDDQIETKEEQVSVKSDTPIHDQLMKSDFGTPVGGGILIILMVCVMSSLVVFAKNGEFGWRLIILLLTMLSFGALGFIDDVRHLTYKAAGKFKGLSVRRIFPIQIILATIISLLLYLVLGFNNIYVPILGNIILGVWYIPLAILAIVGFSNACNISDGLDGLSTGLLTICLVAFLSLAHVVFDVTLSIFVGVWLGAVIAYLYFNVYPARIYLGDAGAFGFGATLAVIGLLTGKIIALGFIGGIYVIILTSSLVQILSKRFLKRKVLPVAPIHMYFKYIGWPEPKIVNRFWLAGAMSAIFGLWLALLSQ